MAELEPWIEKLIQNYGQSQCETTVKDNVVGVSSSKGVSLSSLLDVWHNDIIINILNDATEKITMSATYCPSVATPTHWHRERLHWRVKLLPWKLKGTSC
ncbi:hypothetical protein cypCar_00047557 [Cyprinus carpio]|nr:hypothetical protein cypCar_00047557 [Cyprinus carpio]